VTGHSESDKLDVGCGASRLPGYLGVDFSGKPDVVHDLNVFPWPFAENSFRYVACRHSLGHLNDIVKVMEELHRITRGGGIIEIVSPHFSSDNYFTDVTHRHSFGYRSLDYFCINVNCKYQYSEKAKFRLLQSRISFLQAKVFSGAERKPNVMKWIGLEWCINRFPRLYEHFAAFVIRANEVYFKLEVVKRNV